MIQIGFSGTRQGATSEQVLSLSSFLAGYSSFVGHHGMCVGSDEQFDGLARAALTFDHMVFHPMVFAGALRGRFPASPGDVLRREFAPLARNSHIVMECDLLVATPKEDHQVVRSGTWTTIRYAVQAGKPVFIVLTSGQIVPW